MSGEMFGAPAGIHTYVQDELDTLKTGVSAQHLLGEMAMQPDVARFKKAQAGLEELKLTQEQRFADLMRNAPSMQAGQGGQPTSLADRIDYIARIAADSGLVDRASKLGAQASLIRARDASVDQRQASAARTRIQAIRDQATLAGQVFGSATDAASWETANALYEFQTGQPSPYANIEYSPELVKAIGDAATTAKDRATMAQHRLDQDEIKKYRDARLKQIDFQNTLRERRLDLAKDREERLAKSGGGKGVTSPSKTEIDQAAAMIKKDYSDIEKGDLNDSAYSIASQARALRRSNPALSADQALAQAYLQARQSGDFVQTDSTYGFGGKTNFAGRGKTPADALKFNKGDKPVQGRYYINAQGVTAKWNGRNFEVVGGAAGRDEADDEGNEGGEADEGDE